MAITVVAPEEYRKAKEAKRELIEKDNELMFILSCPSLISLSSFFSILKYSFFIVYLYGNVDSTCANADVT